MNYILFLGNRIGYESLTILIKKGVKIDLAFVEKEHSHENIKYYDKIIEECSKNKITVAESLKREYVFEEIQKNKPDYIMSFGYRRMIPKKIYNLSKRASIGSHFAPLPQYRGFSPLNWVLINGEKETAVNLFHLTDEVDSGDIVVQEKIEIDNSDNINSLFDKCLSIFTKVLEQEIENLEKGIVNRNPQPTTMATYTCARSPEDGLIIWSKPAEEIYNLIRALTYPYPCAFTYYKGKKIYILDSQVVYASNYVGRICGKVIKRIDKEGVVVLCGKDALQIKNIRLEDGVIISSDELVTSIRDNLG